MPTTSRAVIFILIILAALTVTHSQRSYDDVPDTLKKVLEKFEVPTSNKTVSNDTLQRSSSESTDIKETIRKVVVEMRPILDDGNKERKDKFDRVNVGFLRESPTVHLDTANQKYKKLRTEIEKTLSIEPITNETKRIVIETLDQIESELKDNDCVLNKMGETRRRANEPAIVIPNNEKTGKIMKHIKDKWDKVVYQYSMHDQPNSHNDTVRNVAFVFLTRLRQFVFDTHEDYAKLQNRYDIKCSSTLTRSHNAVIKNEDDEDLDKDDACSDVTVCSVELLDFLADFYNQLNDTYTEVFKNYIDMYDKEIKADDDEKESFTNFLNLVLEHAHGKIKKLFTKEIEKLNKTFNSSASRTESLKDLIDRTVNKTKELIYASMSMKLKKFKPKLRYTIKQDIDAAIGIELGNMQKIFKDKMCVVFKTCNGVIPLRRGNKRMDSTADINSIAPNSIKIRLRIDTDKSDLPFRIHKPDYRKIKSSGHEKNALVINDIKNKNARKTNIVRPFNVSEYKHIVNVTRTTYAAYSDVATTKLTSSTKMEDNTTEPLTIYF